MNYVHLIGNLTRDPELRYTPSGTPLCEFGMAHNSSYTTKDGTEKEDVLFIDLTFWGKTAEVIQKYHQKGDKIAITGRLNLDRWTTNDGDQRSKIDIVGRDFTFVDGSGGPGKNSGGQRNQPQGQNQGNGQQSGGGQKSGGGQNFPEDDVSDEEIPF